MMERIRVKKDGTVVKETFTAEEEAARNADIARIKAEDDARADEAKAVADAKAEVDAQLAIDKTSGNQKLLDLGLTQAESTALTNYTPPEDEL